MKTINQLTKDCLNKSLMTMMNKKFCSKQRTIFMMRVTRFKKIPEK